jgi:hypothetical protein
LYTSPGTVSGTGKPRTAAVLDVVPTWEAGGHPSPFSCVSLQVTVASGFPTSPGGRWIVRSLRSPPEIPRWIVRFVFAPAWLLAGAC